MTIVAADNKQPNVENTKPAIAEAEDIKAPIRLLVKNFDESQTLHTDYRGGRKYLHLVRVTDTPDYLSQSFAPMK